MYTVGVAFKKYPIKTSRFTKKQKKDEGGIDEGIIGAAYPVAEC